TLLTPSTLALIVRRITDETEYTDGKVYLCTRCSSAAGFCLALALHANHLLDLGDNCNQIFLVLHHRFNRFVSAGNFIQHARVLAAFNAGSLTLQIISREMTLGRATRHLAARTVRT